MSRAALRLFPGAPRRAPRATVAVRGSARERVAVALTLHGAAGLRGDGEALPLPGYADDDADRAERALAAVAAASVHDGLLLPAHGAPAARLAAALAPHAQALAGSTSARFALECALLDAASRAEGLAAAAWLADGRPLQPVPVGTLLPDDARAPAVAAAAAAAGHRTVKLKIALKDRSPADEDARLAAVRAAVDAAAGPGAVRLRLDANGALAPDAVPARLAALARFGVELVEEPCAGAALLAMPELPLPWAADESLADPAMPAALLALPPRRRPAAWVLKPALLGLVRCIGLAERAAAHGVGLVVTHAFDGDPGFAAARAFAQALPLAPWPCGLAPHAGLQRAWPDGPLLPPSPVPGLLPAADG